MKIYYIDVENIGLDKISEQIINISDKVFLFTHNSKRSTNVKDEYFYYINDYPTGDNQADFCIIANVSKLLSTINKNEINNIEIILFSKDKELWNAFQYQIKKLNIKYSNPFIHIIDNQNKPNIIINNNSNKANSKNNSATNTNNGNLKEAKKALEEINKNKDNKNLVETHTNKIEVEANKELEKNNTQIQSINYANNQKIVLDIIKKSSIALSAKEIVQKSKLTAEAVSGALCQLNRENKIIRDKELSTKWIKPNIPK